MTLTLLTLSYKKLISRLDSERKLSLQHRTPTTKYNTLA